MRTFILFAIALALFVCDYRYHYFSAMRSKMVFVTVSVQRVINFPIKLVREISDNFISKRVLLKENTRLNAELLLANSRLQRLDSIEYDNSQLRLLLQYSKQIKGRVLAAQLLSSVVDKFGRQITIDKGKGFGIYVGQPVLDANGLLGQVIAVEDNMSRVLLITNNKSAIPVMIVRNGLSAIAIGTDDSDYLELLNASETADIKVGDSLVTSGLDGRFPVGYQVGIIKDIKRIVGERFLKILVVPAAKVNNGNLHVLLVWPDTVDKIKLTKKIPKKSK